MILFQVIVRNQKRDYKTILCKIGSIDCHEQTISKIFNSSAGKLYYRYIDVYIS